MTPAPANSALFNLNIRNAIEAIAVAVLGALLGVLQQMLTAHGFDFASYDWGMILQVGAAAFLASLGKDFASDQNGKVFGKF